MAKKTTDEILEEKNKSYQDLRTQQANEQTAIVNQNADNAIAKAERDYEASVQEADKAYIDMINSADIQRELDIRNIRETRANMGLSRSGLASTEVTAANLSAGNKTAAAQRQRQAAIDTLKQSLIDYKATTEAERAANNLSIKQSADTDIFNYKQNEETKRQNAILSSDVSADLKQKAIDEGWSVTQTLTEGKAIADKNEADRVSKLTAGYNNGEFDEDIYRQAIADPNYDYDDALAAQAARNKTSQDTTKENNEKFALEMLAGISGSLYAQAINEGWDIATIVQKAEEFSTNKENTRKQSIEALYSSKQITKYVRDYALANGLTAEQALVAEQEYEAKNTSSAVTAANDSLEANRTALKNLYDKDTTKSALTPKVYSLAYEDGMSPTAAMNLNSKYIEAADVMSEKGKQSTIAYLYNNFSNDYQMFDNLCYLLGITNEDVNEYKSTKANQNAMQGIPQVKKGLPETVYFN